VRLERLVETWGTVIVVDATSSGLDKESLASAVNEVEEFFYQVDRDFSTYKPDSQVSRIRRGELSIDGASEYVQQVWALCEFSRELTLGAFDPWKAEGGFDPSGLVKGWAAEVGAQMLVVAGCESVLINASGDIVLRGGNPDGGPWNIGIANPDD
jgi:thiamine biosynthesis lipoprotein